MYHCPPLGRRLPVHQVPFLLSWRIGCDQVIPLKGLDDLFDRFRRERPFDGCVGEQGRAFASTGCQWGRGQGEVKYPMVGTPC